MTNYRPALAPEVQHTDDVLLRAISRGDLAALGQLYDRHARSMWMAAERTLGSQSDAGDIVHAVFLKLPKIALSYDGRADARAWLAGIVVRVALRQRRGLGRFVKMLSRLTSIPSERSATPEAVASVRQELDRFQTALDALSPKKRAVFVLIELEGLTTDEASRALGIPPGTIRTRLHHARQELHDSVMRGREA